MKKGEIAVNTDDKKNFIQYWETGGFFEEIWRFLVGIHFVILFSSIRKEAVLQQSIMG